MRASAPLLMTASFSTCDAAYHLAAAARTEASSVHAAIDPVVAGEHALERREDLVVGERR